MISQQEAERVVLQNSQNTKEITNNFGIIASDEKVNERRVIKIAIIGSGVAGLSLGLALRRFNQNPKINSKYIIEECIYEKDASFDSRAQGYALTIQGNGLSVLKKLKLDHKMKQRADCMIKSNKTYSMTREHGMQFMSGTEKKMKKDMNFPLPRQEVRKIMLEAYEEESGQVQWNMGLRTFKEDYETNKVVVTFENNTTMECDLLIGCDGLMSAVRREMQLDEDQDCSCNGYGVGDGYGQAQYLGVAMINGIADVTNNDNLRKLTKDAVFQVLDGHSRLFVKPFSMNQSMWLLTYPLDMGTTEMEEYLNHILPSKEKLKEQAIAKVATWSQPIPLFIGNTPVELIRGGLLHQSKQLSSLPSNKFKMTTIIGDAIHAMAPFKGQGFNNALCDVDELVGLLEKHLITDPTFCFASFNTKFEKEMVKRSYKFQIKSKRLVEFLHTADAIDKTKHDYYYHVEQHQNLK
ncbi:hypothetical protein C9374_011637 [Naegleria lovaniensis]|uniref:FAD-binding domain-containing protein n=1 Tax=Naegleria lovaniensis TaxID=51637 RepID=A0AA88KII7_NAELO|nr:uncharacterized protein C9374_011637 [Naegleria lovaniensis]KAG2373972.1 hypothetical protein C9374_011637 [Naegleria lovaniensis]